VISTRAAGPADTHAIAAVWASADAARRAALGLSPLPIERVEPGVRTRLDAADGFGVVAEDAGEAVAMALAVPALADDGAGDERVPGLLHVTMIAVLPVYWGRRIGGTLLERVQSTGRTQGYRRAQLWTHEDNLRAQRLYERLGWTVSGRTKLDDVGELIRHYQREL
jgi:ribosomal protein S18 acetylase RimI-like enzyme